VHLVGYLKRNLLTMHGIMNVKLNTGLCLTICCYLG